MARRTAKLRMMTLGLAAVALATAAPVARVPGALEARRAAAAAALEERVLTENIAFLEAKLAADPDNYVIGGHLAESYVLRFQSRADLSDIERAERVTRQQLAVHPRKDAANARLARILLTQHRFAEAFDAAGTAMMEGAAASEVVGTYYDAATAVGAYDEAAAALERMSPTTFAGAVRLVGTPGPAGDALAAVRRVREACDRLEELGARRSLRGWCLTKVAGIEHERTGPGSAIAWLERALAVDPDNRGALESLADIAYARREWRKAKSLYQRIVTDAHPDLHLRLAEVERALGRDREARRHEERFAVLAAAPGARALSGLTLALYRSGHPDGCAEARRIVEDEMQRRRSAELFETVAWVYWQCGDVAAAVQTLDRAQSVRPLAPGGEALRGLILRATGDAANGSARLAHATAEPTRLPHHALRWLREAGE